MGKRARKTKPGMALMRIHVSTGFVGARREAEFEVDADLSEDEQEEIAREAMFDMIDWGFEVVTPSPGDGGEDHG